MAVDRVVLLEPSGKRRLVVLEHEVLNVPGLGVVRAATLRASVGRTWSLGRRTFVVLEPSVRDLMQSLERRAQIIGPKDTAVLVWNCDLKSGGRVVEVGAGSGAVTLALAHAIGPTGHVVALDVRPDSLEVARRNVAAAGLEGRVEFRLQDGRRDLAERDADATILDIPDPWAAVPAAWDALRACGHLASFSPNMEQVKETVAAIRKRPFVDVRTIELIEREIEVREIGVRPSFAPLGHTGYLTFARKVLDTF